MDHAAAWVPQVPFGWDPIWVSHGLWVFHINGVYSPAGGGEPISNFVGWFITGFVIMTIYQLVVFTTPKERHVRSRYLDIYFPLTMYAFTFLYALGTYLFFVKYYDVAMIGVFSMGGILLMACVKLYLEKQGSQTNPMAQRIVEDAKASLPASETIPDVISTEGA